MRDLEMKTFGSFEIKDEERGEVTAIVATLEVVDRDGDVILPGAVPMGGAKVKLSGYGHDVVLQDAAPVGIGAISEEGGRIVFDGRFFMSTARGREAFATVKELGTDGEWSFGFPNSTVKTAKMTEEWRERGAERLLAALQPVEASPVFRGAGLGTMTVHVKGLKAEDDSLTDRIAQVNDALYAHNEALPGEDRAQYWWARDVFDDHVIVETGAQLFRVEYTVDDDGEVTLGEMAEVEIVYQLVEEKSVEDDPETKSADEGEGEEAQAEIFDDTETKADEDESEEAEEASAEEDDVPDEGEADGDGAPAEAEAEAEAGPTEEELAAAAEKEAERVRDAERKAKAKAAIEEYERVQRTLKRLKVV